LKKLKVISIEKQYTTKGHSPYLVIADDFSRYVLKTPHNQKDLHSIKKEFLCHLLLKVWKIASPDIACLKIEDETLAEKINGSKILGYHFGSQHIANSIDAQSFFTFNKKPSRNKVLNLDDLFKIAYFDIWTSNGDRKPTNQNLLFCPKNNSLELMAIDHAATFESLPFQQLNASWGANFSFNDSILNISAAKNLIPKKKGLKAWTQDLLDKAYLCIAETEKNYDATLAQLPKEIRLSETESKTLRSYLFDQKRNKSVKELFLSIVQDIAS